MLDILPLCGIENIINFRSVQERLPLLKHTSHNFWVIEKRATKAAHEKIQLGGICKFPIHHSRDILSFINWYIFGSEIATPNWNWAIIMENPLLFLLLVSKKLMEEKSGYELAPKVIR